MFLTKDIALLAFWNKIFMPFRKTGWTAPSRHQDLASPCGTEHGWVSSAWPRCTQKQLSFNLLLATFKMEVLISEWSEFNA